MCWFRWRHGRQWRLDLFLHERVGRFWRIDLGFRGRGQLHGRCGATAGRSVTRCVLASRTSRSGHGRDAMPRGLYRKLAADGVLIVDEDLRVSRPGTLIDHLLELGVRPEVIYCVRFMLGTLQRCGR